MEDWQLLREYAAGGSETAFRELMERHLDFVYATARRRLGDAHAAEDVCQAVFCLLARKAAQLRPSGSLLGWLYQTTYHMATKHQISEFRRLRREQTVAQSVTVDSPGVVHWETIAPVLDDAMQQLPEPERQLLLLRFFKGTSFSETGRTMGISEDAARMRVNRTLDKLRELLQQRGVTSTTAALALVLEQKAVEAAPAVSAQAIQAAVLRAIATASAPSLIQNALNFMKQSPIMTAFAIASALLLALISSLLIYNRVNATASPANGNQRPAFAAGLNHPMNGVVGIRRRPGIRRSSATEATDDANHSPAQVNIECKVLELAATATWLTKTLNVAPGEIQVLSHEQGTNLLAELETRKHGTIISLPSVTTLSERQSHISSTVNRYVCCANQANLITNNPSGDPNVCEITYSPVDGPNQMTNRLVVTGHSLEITPQVQDENRVRLAFTPSYTEFLGYQPGFCLPAPEDNEPATNDFMLPAPTILTIKSTGDVTIEPGQWVLCGPYQSDKMYWMQNDPETGLEDYTEATPNPQPVANTSPQRNLKKVPIKCARFFLFTAQLLDAAGNALHSDE